MVSHECKAFLSLGYFVKVREAVHKLKKKKRQIFREKGNQREVDIQLVKEVFTEQIQIRLKLGSGILLGTSRKGQIRKLWGIESE